MTSPKQKQETPYLKSAKLLAKSLDNLMETYKTLYGTQFMKEEDKQWESRLCVAIDSTRSTLDALERLHGKEL